MAIGGATIPAGYKLAVAGNIIAEKVNVKLQANWPDYVFKPGYVLPSLAQVEQFINTNGHLKDVPSAKEVEKNGISLGEMDAKLLKKIEELTLYTIDQQKLIDAQKKEIDESKKLSERLTRLEKLIEQK